VLWKKEQAKNNENNSGNKGKYRIFTVVMARQGTDLGEYRQKLGRWLSILATCKSCVELELLEDGDFKGCYAYTEVWKSQKEWYQELQEKSKDKEYQEILRYIFNTAGRDISFIFRGFNIIEEPKKKCQNDG